MALLPTLTPATALGGLYTAAYAARQGTNQAAYAGAAGSPLTPEQAGQAVTDLVTGDAQDQDAYVLSGAGLRPLA